MKLDYRGKGTLMSVVGIYAGATANLDKAIGNIQGLRMLRSLDPSQLKQLDCVLIDVRSNSEAVLKQASRLNGLIPVIALADNNTCFKARYPFGCHVHDHTTIAELGSALFWHRVATAVAMYSAPMSDAILVQPIYTLLQEIVNHSSDWIFVKDLDHRFLLASDNFAKLANRPLQEIIGKNDLEIGTSEEQVHGDPKTHYKGFWPQDDAVTQGGIISIEENPHWDLFSNTEQRCRRTIRIPLKDHNDNVYALLVCSQDITDQRKNESLLADRTQMLVRVTKEKKSAEKNRQIAEEAVMAKARFLAAASHDLRQPLHAMGLFLDVLDTRMSGDKDRHLVQQVKQSCVALNTLFNGCLDISRLDAGVIDRADEDFFASLFIESLSDEFRQQAIERDLDYRVEVDNSVLFTDSMLLARIVRNLVNNAIDNTEKGQILIRCQKGEGTAQLSVTDTGVGIAEKERDLIFREFHQVSSSQNRQGKGTGKGKGKGKGLGLGLAIVKRLCELLEIKLQLTSETDRGSCFSLSVPLGCRDNILVAAPVMDLPSLEGAQVLIVDDDPSIRFGMEVLLQTYGCNTVSGANVRSVMRALSSTSMTPDVIIADYHLGEGDNGALAINAIRDALQSNIPAVLVTGDTSLESEQDALNHSLRILYKPVRSELLLSAVAGELTQVKSST